MGKSLRLLFVVSIVALSAALIAPATTSAQGGGGIIIDATFGQGSNTLSPIFCNDTACARPVGLMFPAVTAVDTKTATIVKGAAGGLAKDWTISDDGLTYTFKLRTDWKWSDGKPITAKDVVFTYNTILNPDSKSPLASSYTQVVSVTAPDDTTVVFKFKEANCRALLYAGAALAPVSVLGEVDVKTLKDNAYSTKPSVSAGPFQFGEFRASERVSMLANPNYPDAVDKAVKPEGYIQKVVPDQNVLIEQLLAGEINFQDNIPPARIKDVLQAQKDGKLQVYEWSGRTWDYLALNYANPKNPQAALDKDGKAVAQDPHPILSDKKVRQALAISLDIDEMIKGAVFGYGTRMASSIIPSSWAFNKDLKPLPYDPEQAKKLLDEAGWKVGSDGIRAKDGVKLHIELRTNSGNTRREAIGNIVKDKWTQIGVDVDYQAVEFNGMVEALRGQKFDAVIIGWQNGYPPDPDQTSLFTSQGDIPNSGQNYVSYVNPDVDKMMKDALTLKGCDTTARKAIYDKIQVTIQQDLPYIFLFSQNGYYVASSKIKGFAPHDGAPLWNVDAWTVAK